MTLQLSYPPSRCSTHRNKPIDFDKRNIKKWGALCCQYTALFPRKEVVFISEREERRYVIDFKTSFCGQVVCNPSFLRKQTINSPRSRLVVTSLLGFGKKNNARQVRETVIPDPDYRIPIVLLGLAGGLAYTDNLVPAIPVDLLGLLLLFQTTRVRFVFEDEALEVKIGEQLQESGENVFVGGKNRWKYSTFVNWELWWPNFPILVYFKETQTKPEGQIHFFPVIFNGKQLYDVMVERAGPSKNSGPNVS